MKFCTKLLLALALILATTHCIAQQNAFTPNNRLRSGINRVFAGADIEYKKLAKKLPPGRFPKAYDPKVDTLETSNSGWWCSGFYPGTLLNIYERTHDEALNTEANRILRDLAKEQFNTHTHDLGFMMYCSFGNAYRLNPTDSVKQILINSAKSLSTRFSPVVGCIKSWDAKPSDFLVIIDNMMNLELLFWATKTTGDSSFYKIAVTHANTTIKNHYRPNFSSYHVINYDPASGIVKEKKTAQGFANESAWARGQAWGLYGFTVMYRETQDQKYLDQANGIANFILNHPNLPADKIPYWDFDASNIPNALRDASAAAIVASALLELCRYTDKADAQKYFAVAETMLNSLAFRNYMSRPGESDGFLLKHSVGHLPAGTEVDVSLTYADYYFIEALKRYEALSK